MNQQLDVSLSLLSVNLKKKIKKIMSQKQASILLECIIAASNSVK